MDARESQAEPVPARAERAATAARRARWRGLTPAIAGLLLVLGAATVGGCSGKGGQPGAGGTTPASGSQSSGSAGFGTPTGAPAGDGNGGNGQCKVDQLNISFGEGGAAAGHWGVVLIFARTGTGTCHLEGYPGVAALDAAGNQAAQARRTLHGYIGGLGMNTSKPPRVDMPAGATASALIEGTNVPTGNATSCPNYDGLLVTPPDETHSVKLDAKTNGCDGLQIHPVVPGNTGQEKQ